MAFVDLMANHTDSRIRGMALASDSIGSSSLLPSFFGALHPPATHLPAVCQNCLNQREPLYNGLCPSCIVPPPPPRLDQDLTDSFSMLNMLNFLDDNQRDDQTCNSCGVNRADCTYNIDHQQVLCPFCSSLSHGYPPTSIGRKDSTSPKLAPTLSPQSSTSYFSDCSIEENEEDSGIEYCDSHTNEKLCFFCQSCSTVVCSTCLSTGHKHHHHTTIKEAYVRITPSVETIASNTFQKIEDLSMSIELATGMREKIVRKKEEAIKKVQQVFQNYREAIIQQEKELIAQMSGLADLRLRSLTKEKESNKKMLVHLKGLHDNMSNAKGFKKKASTLVLHHTMCLEDGQYSNCLPIEDDSFIVKTDNANIVESLKTVCILTTAPYPPLCSAVGEGLFHQRVNRLTSILVATKDRMGEPCTEGGEGIYVTLRANCDGSLLKVDVRDNHDGSYGLSFRPKVKGEHQLSVCIRGHHINGSPFKLNVDGGREYSHYGMITKVFGKEGNKPGQFCRPWGIASDQNGNVIIGDRSNHRIQIFDSNGNLKRMFGSEGTGKGQFNRPAGVAVTREGHIVVADKDNHRIQVLKMDGTFLFKFGSKGGNDGQMIYPYDVAVSQTDGRIAVTDTGNHRLLIFSSDGILLGKFGYKGYLCGHFDSPRGIAFNDEGHIVVSDFNVHHILVIHPDGTTARILGSQGVGNGQFMRPQGIAVDHLGNFVIADTRNSRVVIMHQSGHFIAKLGSPGSGQGQLDRPTSVTVLPDGRIAVVDFGNSRIQIF